MQSWLGADQWGMHAQRFTRTCASSAALEDKGRRKGRTEDKKKEIKKREGREGMRKRGKDRERKEKGRRERGRRGKEGGAGFTSICRKTSLQTQLPVRLCTSME